MALLNHGFCASLGAQEASCRIYIERPAPFCSRHINCMLAAHNPSKAKKVVHGTYHLVSERQDIVVLKAG
jgi:hypothetical protein